MKKILLSSEVKVKFTIALEWKTWFLFFPDSTKGTSPTGDLLSQGKALYPRIKLIREGKR